MRCALTNPEANVFYLKFPETPLRATYFARLVALLGCKDESMFYGALLWITLLLHAISKHSIESVYC
jgi:hypothetical protein